MVEEISIKAFGRPFVHQVKINRRMKTTGGRYHLDDHHLEINAHFLEAENRQYLVGIIKHELTHYHLHLLGLGYRHKDHDFKVLLKRVGGHATRQILARAAGSSGSTSTSAKSAA